MKNVFIALMLITALAKGQSSPNIVNIEFWVDVDPGFGLATPVASLSPDSIISNFQFNNVISLVPGIHTLGIRSKDANNAWSLTNHVPFIITDTAVSSNLSKIEYFWDGDSGFSANFLHPLSFSVQDTSSYLFNLTVPNFAIGSYHILFYRTWDSNGKVSLTNHYTDSVQVITAVENLPTLSGINIYPNPFADNITVQPKENSKMRLTIYDAIGNLAYDKTIIQTTVINLSQLSHGFYSAFIWAENNKIFKTVLIKQ